MEKKSEEKIVKWSKTKNTVVYDGFGRAEIHPGVPDYVVRDVVENGCTMPRLERVEYSFKKATADEPAVLATIVFFDDGTKSIVKNCLSDAVGSEDWKLSDGSTVEVASQDSKERGFVYALLKRLLSNLDEDGNAVCSGLGNSLREIVAGAVDQNVVAAEKRIAKTKPAEQPACEKPAKKAKRDEAGWKDISESLSCLAKLVEKLAAAEVAEKEASFEE